jgi:hypothetical protein
VGLCEHHAEQDGTAAFAHLTEHSKFEVTEACLALIITPATSPTDRLPTWLLLRSGSIYLYLSLCTDTEHTRMYLLLSSKSLLLKSLEKIVCQSERTDSQTVEGK